MPPQRAKTSCVLTVVVCAAFGCGSVLAQPASDEYRLKAAFLYRFPEFVEWPPAALEGRQAVGVCVVQLRVVESRVRFEIGATAAQQAGLRLSSQLLRLALNVRGAPL